MHEPCPAYVLDDWLARHSPAAEETVWWSLDPPLRLRVASILAAALPPEGCISSVRAVVLGAATVLVLRDPHSVHILPGGRREPGEAMEQTLAREVREESGWSIGPPRLLGCSVFTHLGPKPPDYGYPYPRFVHAVYAARALQHRPETRQADDYELEATMQPLPAVAALALGPGQHVYLDAALRELGFEPATGNDP